MWHYVYRVADGSLVADCSTEPVELDASLAYVSFAERHNGAPEMLWNPATLDFDLPRANPTKIPRGRFLLRFTPSERGAIDTGADVPASIPRDFRNFVTYTDALEDGSGYVDLEHPGLVAVVHALESMGLIGVGRADEVLTP